MHVPATSNKCLRNSVQRHSFLDTRKLACHFLSRAVAPNKQRGYAVEKIKMSQTAVTSNAQCIETRPLPVHLLHQDGLHHGSMPIGQAQTSSKGPMSEQTAIGGGGGDREA